MVSFRRIAVLIVSAVCAGSVASLTGCMSLARQAFRTPTVELKNIEVRGIGLDGGSLNLKLDVYNPNDYRMDATRMTYTLLADTLQVATGAVDHRVTLAGKNHNDVTLPVSFSMKELMGAAQILLKTGSVDYQIKGDVTVDTPFGSMTRPYAGKMRIDNATLLRP